MKRDQKVRLGFAIGSGDPIDVPLRNTVVTGQTQEAGKTTAMEAMITRSGLSAITFITKRGEGSFANSRTIQPYFREQADWQFVRSLLEASRREKMKFETAWIMRASKGANSLADVQKNVKHLMDKAKGMSADMYLVLDGYLDELVPQISGVKWAKSVDLHPGVNVMDMTSLTDSMQGLVIRSTLDWVLNKEKNTVVVVPEAWKFIPQGRGTPVKLGAEAYVRQGSGLGNFLWLDSQDIGGIEKAILRSCPLWILGVQREANEIKRTLQNIPAGIKKPKSDGIAMLELGQFFACWRNNIHKTYAQPAWMSSEVAIAISKGEREVYEIGAPPPKPSAVAEIEKPEPSPVVAVAEPESFTDEDEMSREDIDELKSSMAEMAKAMTKLASAKAQPIHAEASRMGEHSSGNGSSEEGLYERLKARLVEDAPALIRLLAEKPEINLEVQRNTIEMDKSSLNGRIAFLIHSGFCKKPVKHGDIKKEMERTGSEVNGGNLSKAIAQFVKLGFLTDEADGYREVEGMKVNIVKK